MEIFNYYFEFIHNYITFIYMEIENQISDHQMITAKELFDAANHNYEWETLKY